MLYTMLGSEGYECAICKNDEDYDIFNGLQGSSLAEDWQPVCIIRIPLDDGRPALPSDFPWMLSSNLIMRRRAVFALRDLLEAGGEILPLATRDNVALSVLNVTRVIDALDVDNSIVEYAPDSDKILIHWTHAFHEPLVCDVPFFRLPNRSSPIFVNESFKRRVSEAGLVGLDFIPAWSPETGAIKQPLW